MTPVGKALWYIEAHLASPLDLDQIAKCAAVSRFHLARAFVTATGMSIMRYVRGRRLSEAARQLAAGAPDILSVAVAAEYSSHEAFTRAFREQFGLTPDAVRAQGHLHNLSLLEPLAMHQPRPDVPAPRIETGPLLLVAGLTARYACNASAGIPAQWQRFITFIDRVPRRTGAETYGVCSNSDDDGTMDYLCGVQVSSFTDLPQELTALRIPARRYAIFWHAAHVSTIRGTWNVIWNGWLPQSGCEIADAPWLERYDRRFDPASGDGGVELWVPLQ